MLKQNEVKDKIKNGEDKLIMNTLITINIYASNPNFENNTQYSSHIVKAYKTKENTIYYVFIQPYSQCNANECEKYGINLDAKGTCWGQFIMNYGKYEYKELSKILNLEEGITIFGVPIKNLEENFMEAMWHYIPETYREV